MFLSCLSHSLQTRESAVAMSTCLARPTGVEMVHVDHGACVLCLYTMDTMGCIPDTPRYVLVVLTALWSFGYSCVKNTLHQYFNIFQLHNTG